MYETENYFELIALFKNILPALQENLPKIIDIIKQIIDFINSPEGQMLIQILTTIIKIIIGLLGTSAFLPDDSQIYYTLVKGVQGFVLFENLIKYSEMNMGHLEEMHTSSVESTLSLDLKEVVELSAVFLFASFSNMFLTSNNFFKSVSLIITLVLFVCKLWESKTSKSLTHMSFGKLSMVHNEERFNAFIEKHKETELTVVLNAFVVSVNQALLTYMIIDKGVALFQKF